MMFIVLYTFFSALRSRRALALDNLALRHQLENQEVKQAAEPVVSENTIDSAVLMPPEYQNVLQVVALRDD
jgi:hypothetical protein